MELQIEVPPTYPTGFKLVFVGEAPGAEEVEHREGFVGAAGRCLQRACQVSGLDWRTCGRTNVAKRRPLNNKFKEAFYETIKEPIYTPKGNLSKKTKKVSRKTEELLQYESLLGQELRERLPNLIVACGNEALSALTGIEGITNYRGSILPSTIERPEGAGPFKVLAVEHPSYIIRGGGKKLDVYGESEGSNKIGRFWILCHDLKKARREMEFPEIRREPTILESEPSKDIILSNLAYLAHNKQEIWTLDIETRAATLACFAIGYQLANGKWYSFCIPIQTTSGPYWSPSDEWEIWRALYNTARCNPNLCNQNIEYDLDYLLRYGVEPSGIYMDTMLAHSILYPEFPKGLDFLCSFYLDDATYYKGEGRTWGIKDPDPQLWLYCCKDAVYTRRIVDKIDEELKRRNLYEFYHGSETT